MSVRKIWEAFNGKIPTGYEIHHKTPKHAGGTDEIDNLEMLTVEEHKAAHLQRYHDFGNFRDLCAYYMICHNFTEAHKISSGAGGRKGGKTTKNAGIGIFRDEQERSAWAALGGKAAQDTLKQKAVSAFYDPILRAKSSSAGGLASPAFKDSRAQSARGKKGGKTNAGTVWVTDGKISFKFRPSSEESIQDFLLKNQELKLGRQIKRKEK